MTNYTTKSCALTKVPLKHLVEIFWSSDTFKVDNRDNYKSTTSQNHADLKKVFESVLKLFDKLNDPTNKKFSLIYKDVIITYKKNTPINELRNVYTYHVKNFDINIKTHEALAKRIAKQLKYKLNGSYLIALKYSEDDWEDEYCKMWGYD
jgi:hypothetical protein